MENKKTADSGFNLVEEHLDLKIVQVIFSEKEGINFSIYSSALPGKPNFSKMIFT